MQTACLLLSYVAKIAGFVAALNVIPGIPPSTGVIIFFVASLVKDTANRTDDFLTANFLSKNTAKAIILGAVLIGAGSAVTACNGNASANSSAPGVTSTGSATTGQAISGAVNIAGDMLKLVLDGAASYNDVQTTLSAAQQTMGGHGVSVQNIGAYANAESSSANSSGLPTAISAVQADVQALVAAGTSESEIVSQLTKAQTSVPATPAATPATNAPSTYAPPPVARDRAGNLVYSF